MGDAFSSTKQVHRRSHGESHVTECELQVELADTHLRREFSHDGREVKLLGYPVHRLKSDIGLNESMNGVTFLVVSHLPLLV